MAAATSPTSPQPLNGAGAVLAFSSAILYEYLLRLIAPHTPYPARLRWQHALLDSFSTQFRSDCQQIPETRSLEWAAVLTRLHLFEGEAATCARTLKKRGCTAPRAHSFFATADCICVRVLAPSGNRFAEARKPNVLPWFSACFNDSP